MSIPKIIHLSWKSKDILDSTMPFVEKGVKNLVKLNPNWTVEISDDDDVDQYLRDNLDKQDYLLIQDAHIVAKLDIWRLIKLYKVGGLYIDIDRYCNISLDSVLDDKIKCVIPTCLDFDFTHDFMLSAPQNPIYSTALNLNLKRRQQGHTNIYFLGPQTYMNAVTYCLTGQEINTDPGVEIVTQLRQLISSLNFVLTYREYPPLDTFLFRNEQIDQAEYEALKKEFYHSNGLKHWSGEW